MKHQKTLAAVHKYIVNFDPDEFSSPPDFTPARLLTPGQRADIQKLKARIKRKRLLLESLDTFFDCNIPEGSEGIITQKEVDDLLEGWSGAGKKP